MSAEEFDDEADYVVVGAGSAGCVLASRLSEDPSVKVLLLEAGGVDRNLWIHIPVGYLYTMGNPDTDWMYRTVEEAGLNGRSIPYPRGKTLGGSSSINGMIYMRGQKRDYENWKALGNFGWGWDDVLPVFKRSESHHAGESRYHGGSGPWRVERPRVEWEALNLFAEAAREVGIPKVADFNTGDNEGVGYFEVTQKRGRRHSLASAFLKPVMSRPNLRVVTEAHAESILFDEARRACGISYVRGAETASRRAKARLETILCAGAIGSPQLLELSGAGRPDRLSSAGVEVRHPLAGVGENLHDHLQIRCVFKVDRLPTVNTVLATPFGKFKAAARYALFRDGPLSMAPSQLGAFVKSSSSRQTANLQFHVQPVSLDKFGDPPHPFDAFTASVCNLRPESRGETHIVSSDARDAPAIRLNYLDAAADKQVAAEAIRAARRIVAAPALRRAKPQEYLPGAEIVDDDELVVAAGNISTSIFHPVGTCRMGRDDMAVVDDRLRVRGIDKLRVIDASIMPTITSGNTNAPTVMIAEKGAEMLISDRRG